MNWNAFTPISSKRGALKTLIERAYLICSTDELQNRELKHIEKVFYENNCYPKYVIKQYYSKYLKNIIMEQMVLIMIIIIILMKTTSFMNNESVTLEKQPLLVLPYQGKKGDHI